MKPSSPSSRIRPDGADNYLKWRRTIDEHLELRRLVFAEYGMFNWLCTKANPWTGTARTSWPTLAEQTGLSRTYVEKLCRSLKRKRYVWYPSHRGKRGRLVEVTIDKFPLAGDTYTDLSARFEHVPSLAPTLVPTEVGDDSSINSGTSVTERKRKRTTSSLRVRSADLNRPERFLSKPQALAEAPPALRETLELYWFKTGREGLDPADVECLHRLDQAHTPAVTQKAITTAVERFERRGEARAALTFGYIWESLRHYTTRKPPEAARVPKPEPKYPIGVTRLW